MNTSLIAEIGINPGGNIKIAHEMIDAAFKSGANVIKFQVHLPEKEMIHNISDYVSVGKNLYEIIKKCSFSFNELSDLKKHCDDINVEFLATPFSLEAVDFLQSINVKRFKVGSGETNDHMILGRIGATKKEVILSTGMSAIDNICLSVSLLRSFGCSVILMQCTSSYPCLSKDIHLNTLKLFKDYFKCKVGLSDHSPFIYPSIAAVALGASVIEKHFTLDKSMDGPDHSSSLNPEEFLQLSTGIKCVEDAMGNYEKNICVSNEVRSLFQHGVTATRTIKKGETISLDMITSKRPLVGISSQYFINVVGRVALKDIQEDTQIQWEDISTIHV